MLARSLALLLLARNVLAHCQLAWPYPLHSALNPATPEDIKDYSMTSPLVSSGTYPCKGYINNPASDMFSTATWTAGSTYNYTIVGTATHGGGSCQLAMSYDDGATWNVILSLVGGCLVDGMTQEFTLPAEAPSGDALFAWNWFNREGNREMYQNCAVITVENGGSGLTGPTPFVANADVNSCTTIENIDVVFPDPGDTVIYGGSYASSKPTTAAGYTGSDCVGPSASASGSAGATAGASGSASLTTATSSSASVSGTTATSSSAAISDAVVAAASPSSTTSSVSDSGAAPTAASSAPTSTSTSSSTCSTRRKRNLVRKAAHSNVPRRDLDAFRVGHPGKGIPPRDLKERGSSGVSRTGHPLKATRPGRRSLDERGSSGVTRHPLTATKPGKRALDERGSSGVDRAGHPLKATRPGRRALAERGSSGVSRNGHPRPATKPGKRALDERGSSGVNRAGHPLKATRPQ
ncbi:hypothetical protein Q5752_003071 [Cryptotrichosporon argae]